MVGPSSDPSNRLLVISSADGANWTHNVLVGGQTTQASPALSVLGNRLFLAFVANNASREILINSSADGTNWTDNTKINQACRLGPAMTLQTFNPSQHQLNVSFIANNDTESVLFAESDDGAHWSGNTVIQTLAPTASPAIAILGGLINVVTNTRRGLVNVRPFTDGLNSWKQVGQGEKFGMAPALAVY